MSDKHATVVQGVPFREKPRRGQLETWEALADKTLLMLTVKLPTGYGKTYTFCGAYSIRQHQELVDGILIIFPKDWQLEQFIRDGHISLRDAGVKGPLQVIDVRFHRREAIKKRRNGECQVFCITIQALLARNGADNVAELMAFGTWMVAVDEHHHYGLAKMWGRTVLALKRAFMMVLSATPSRPTEDGAFGQPLISVTYRDAVKENAVKPLRGHSYEFLIHVTNAEGEEVSFTTSQFFDDELGTDEPESVERIMVERKMRWSPKYVSPLVATPIERMLIERLRSGRKLQALVSAVCVSHAKLICDQLREMFPELNIEWVGTGINGRSDEENKSVLSAFCPEKDDNGQRPKSSIDVLVHVGMAGEGLDTIFVSEIVFLMRADLNNRVLQIVGRGSRRLDDVICNVSYDSSSKLAQYTGSNMELAMDLKPPNEKERDPDPEHEWPPELPDEPTIHIYNMELVNIDSGMPGVQIMAKTLAQEFPAEFQLQELLDDRDHAQWEKVISAYRTMRVRETRGLDERAVIDQWDEAVEAALSAVTRIVLMIMRGRGQEVEAFVPGKIKVKIRSRAKDLFGAKAPNIELLGKHYRFCKQLERELLTQKELPPEHRRIPKWLQV